MYSVYSDDICIYDDTMIADEYRLVAPKLSLAVNSAGTFTCTVPAVNTGYNEIRQMTSYIRILKDGEEIWEGRVLSEQMDFKNNRIITCEGELAFLNDTIQPPGEFHDISPREFLEEIFGIHNGKVKDSRKEFYVGAVTVTDPDQSLYKYTNYENTLQSIQEKLLDRLGGFLRIRKENGKRYVDYLKEYPDTTTQKIEFGKNLIDYTRDWDQSEFCTVIIPRGARLEESPIEGLEAYVNVAEVNNGSIFVYDQSTVDEFGWIEKVVSFDEIKLPSNLLQLAEEYLKDIQFDKMQLEVSAVDLHYLNTTTEDIRLLDRVRVISEPHGMDRVFPVVKLEIPLDQPENTTFTMGADSDNSWTGASNRSNNAIYQALDYSRGNLRTIIDQVRENAQAMMNLKTNGFFTIATNENGTNEVYFADEQDPEKAQHVWRWNMNGLAYSKNGYKGPYEIAITADGTIYGQFIAANSIAANKISQEYRNKVETRISESGQACNTYTDQKFTAADGKFQSAISQINTLSDNVDDEISSVRSEISQTASEIRTTINSKERTLNGKISECNTAITQTANSISTEVSNRIDAVNSMSTRITQLSNSISSLVSEGEFGTLIEQNSEGVRVAWNRVSDYVYFQSGGLYIYNGSNTKLVGLDSDGITFYRGSTKVGFMRATSNSRFEINFDGDYFNSFLMTGNYYGNNAYPLRLTFLEYDGDTGQVHFAGRGGVSIAWPLVVTDSIDCTALNCSGTVDADILRGNHYSSDGYQGYSSNSVWTWSNGGITYRFYIKDGLLCAI